MDEGLPGFDGGAELRDLLTRLFVSMDEGRWSDVADCFAERVLFDLSSLGSGRPTRTSRAKVVETLEKGIKGMAAVQHQIGNVLTSVSEEDASAFCYCTASYYFPNPSKDDTQTRMGSYDFHLTRDPLGWRIDAFRYNLKFSCGNPRLPELASKASRSRLEEDDDEENT